MRYHGGKAKLAKHIVSAISQTAPAGDREFFDVFAGGMSVTCAAAGAFPHRTANDIDSELVDMWRAVSLGWQPPDNISEQDYARLRDEQASPERTFASIACSYGAKKWGGYARGGTRNYAAEGARGIGAKAPALRDVTFTSGDYRDLDPPAGSVVYCDPPYADTTGYRSGEFDHEDFWNWCDFQSETCHVFVSEFTVPSTGWDTVWYLPRKVTTSLSDYKRKTDLLVYRGP